MKPFIWLRSLAVVLVLFAVGHTLGTASPQPKRGPIEAAVFDSMKRFQFPIMGFERSHWDFYRGFAVTITILLVALALLAWQTASVSREHPRQARPLALTLLLTCVGLTVGSWSFFFAAPIVMSCMAVAIAAVAVIAVWRDTRAAGRALTYAAASSN